MEYLFDRNYYHVCFLTKMCLLERDVMKDEVCQREEKQRERFTKKWNIFDMWHESNNLWT